MVRLSNAQQRMIATAASSVCLSDHDEFLNLIYRTLHNMGKTAEITDETVHAAIQEAQWHLGCT
jgi:hypothetical protein